MARTIAATEAKISRVTGLLPGAKTPPLCLVPGGNPVIHVRGYTSANWFTTEGVRRKRRQIEARGLPKMRGWRFITLTLDRVRFGADPETKLGGDAAAGYIAGKNHLRYFMHSARTAGLWTEENRWAWKLEFQSDGWAHWHLLLSRKKKFSKGDFDKIKELWALGWTHCRMIDDNAAKGYPFKYAFKPVSQDIEGFNECGEDFAVPAWFLDYHRGSSGKEGDIPETFGRVRFWQTGKNFYTSDCPETEEETEEEGEEEDTSQFRSPFRWTARELLQRARSLVQVVARRSDGRYMSSGVTRLECDPGLFWGRVGFETLHGAAVGLAVSSYVIPTSLITRHTVKTCQLTQLLQKNRFSLRRAKSLAAQGQTLRTS